jgi:hypothetical protein
MRTTIDLPPELFRRAKAHAATRGESLKQVFARAIAAEVGGGARPSARRDEPVSLPLIRTRGRAPRPFTAAELERRLAEDDVRRVAGTPRARASKRR